MSQSEFFYGEFDDVVQRYMDLLKTESNKKFQSQLQKREIGDEKKERKVLDEMYKDIEAYLQYVYMNYPENFRELLITIIPNFTTIACLPRNIRGVYGMTEDTGISVNPDLVASCTLTSSERRRLYIAHEMGHIINRTWMKKVEEWCNQQIHAGQLTQEHAQCIYDGFSLLDEAIAQERAEEFTYDSSNKDRPKQVLKRREGLFKGAYYQTNFDWYGELQAPATMFARTLRGIGKENDDSKALKMLATRALQPDFFDKILGEYEYDNQMGNFIKEFQYMGLLKRASYAIFGMQDNSYLENSGQYLERIQAITTQMRDYRDPISNPNDAR